MRRRRLAEPVAVGEALGDLLVTRGDRLLAPLLALAWHPAVRRVRVLARRRHRELVVAALVLGIAAMVIRWG